jgi:hypothetical protein
LFLFVSVSFVLFRGPHCIRIRFETEDGPTLLGICNIYSGEEFPEYFTYGRSFHEEKARQAIGITG